MADLSRQRLRQPQHDHLQSRDIGEVLGVRREQPEVTLNRLCRKPEVVDPNVRISAGLSELCSHDPERLSGFKRDPQLRLRRSRRSIAVARCFCEPGRSISTPNRISATFTGER